MKVFVFVIAVALIAIASFEQIEAQGEVRFACNNGTFGPTADLRNKLAACHDPKVYGAEDGKKDPKCAAYCFTEAIRGLKDGQPDKEAFIQLIENEIPEAQRVIAKTHMDFCFEKHGKVDSADPKCVEIAAFSACGTSLIMKTTC